MPGKVVYVEFGPGLVDYIFPDAQKRREYLELVAWSARTEWAALAQQGLRSTQAEYIGAIQIPLIIQDNALIDLRGQLPNMVEWGWDGGDMRQWMLRPGAPGVHGPSRTGSYWRVIPFRHMNPEATGAFGRPMPEDTYQVAKGLKATRQHGGRTHWGERLPASQGGPLLKSWHSTGIYTGMIRSQRQGGHHAQYTTFRAISSTPGPGWHHPGLQPPRGYMHETQRWIESNAGMLLNQTMEA